MTLEDAKKEIPTYKVLAGMMCVNCTANDWYCPTWCVELEKGSQIPLERLQKMYAKYDGDLEKLTNYIKYTKVLLRGEE